MSEAIKFIDAMTPREQLRTTLNNTESMITLIKEKHHVLEVRLEQMVEIGHILTNTKKEINDEDILRYLAVYKKFRTAYTSKGQEREIMMSAVDVDIENLKYYLLSIYSDIDLKSEAPSISSIESENKPVNTDKRFPLTKENISKRLTALNNQIYFYNIDVLFHRKDNKLSLEDAAKLTELGNKMLKLFDKVNDILGPMSEIEIKPEDEDVYRILINGMMSVFNRASALIYNRDLFPDLDVEIENLESNIVGLNDSLVQYIINDVKTM